MVMFYFIFEISVLYMMPLIRVKTSHGAKVYFSCRPPEGITRPGGSKEVEKSAEKPTESCGEVNV